MNVVLRLLKATVEFLWWVGWWVGRVCKVNFMSNPTTVLRLCCWLCCAVVGVVPITKKEGYFMDPEFSEMVWFLNTEIAEIQQFLDPHITEMNQKISR